MTTKPTQEQTGQEPQPAKTSGLLQRYATPIPPTSADAESQGRGARPGVPTYPAGNGNGQGVGNAPFSVAPSPAPLTRPAAGMTPPGQGTNGNGLRAPQPPPSMQPVNRVQTSQPSQTQMPPTQAGQQVTGVRPPAQGSFPNPASNGMSNRLGHQLVTGGPPSLPPLGPGPQGPLSGSGGQMQRPLASPPSTPLGSALPQPPELEREGNNVILHRSEHFILRTAYRPGFQRLTNILRRPTGHTTMLPKVMPGQRQHVAESDTKMMPSVAPINPLKNRQVPVPLWLEAAVIVFGLVVSLIAHAYNIFNFPRYELDEGTYMSGAWAILHGMITPYAYGYGHPPLAWVQIAGWIQLTGGFFTFGDAVNSGRIFMLVYAVGSALLVYLIVRRLGASRSAGLLAMVMFSLSPISLTYQRQVLLDNVGTFWLLLSFYLMVVGNSRLVFVVFSALTFGVAILSKEIFVLFIPVMIYAIWLHTTKFQRKFALVAFIYTVIAVGSGFVLMAVLKGELLPQGWLPWDKNAHLSLIGTYLQQAVRGQAQGSLVQSWAIWTQADLVLMICSVATLAFNLVMGWWNRKQLLVALMGISFWVLLARGGVVLTFYIIPLIPLVAINAAFAVNTIMGWLGKLVRFDFVRAVLVLGVIAAIVPYDLIHAQPEFTLNFTAAQTQSIAWVRSHVPHNSFVVVNDWMYVDLHQPGGMGVGDGSTYPFANVYFNVATDPAIEQAILANNPDRIDYIVEDSQMSADITGKTQFAIINNAIKQSVIVAHFKSGTGPGSVDIFIYQVVHKFAPPVVMMPHGPQSQPTATVAFVSNPDRIDNKRFM